MLLSLNHLNRYLPKIKLDQSVTIALNKLGFEVEDFYPFSDAKGVVFAKVLDIYPNPNSDKLTVAKVQTKDGILTIQTTSKALQVGKMTICYVAGSSKGDQVFKNVKLRGVESQGMFASWSEIGYAWENLSLVDDLVFFEDNFATLEEDPHVKLGLNDFIINLSTTANRNDANSYFVIAKELAAYYQTELSLPKNQIKASFESQVKVHNLKSQGLMFLEVKGQKQTSLEERLLLAKHNIDAKHCWAINLTNLCLLETGAPAHVYNKDVLSNNLGDNLYSGKLEILGQKEVEVNNVLVIEDKDQKRPISIACSMGLEATRVSADTENLLFEIGIFDPKLVRHSAKEIKLMSNSAAQGSRVISKEVALTGMQYLQNQANDLEYSNIINEVDQPNKKEIKWDQKTFDLYSGNLDMSEFEVAKKQLSHLGFKFTKDIVLVPNYRYDVDNFAGITEEIFRFYSYDNFKPAPYKNRPILTQPRDIFKNLAASKGYFETRTFTLVSQEKTNLNPFNFNESVKLVTFVSKEREVIRNSIVTSLLEVVGNNAKKKISDLNLFEKGMINSNIIVNGFASTTKDFKTFAQDILDLLNLDVKLVPFVDNKDIHYNTSAKILYQGKMVGWIGKLHPSLDPSGTLFAEFIDNLNDKKSIKFSPANQNPIKVLDLTFELQVNEHIASRIEEIKSKAQVFSVKQIDDFYKQTTNTRFVTLRISGEDEQIEKLDKIYNK